MALQADGKSPLAIKGETRFTLTYSNKSFHLEALVVENLDVEILAGIPFLSQNDITLRPALQQIQFSDDSTHHYYNKHPTDQKAFSVKGTSAQMLRSPAATVWPGKFLELNIPTEWQHEELEVEPRSEDKTSQNFVWPQPML